MTDVRTNQPMQVLRGPESTAMMYIAMSQLPAVQALFDQNKVNYWLMDVIADLGDGHPFRGVGFSRNENHDRVQELLDVAP